MTFLHPWAIGLGLAAAALPVLVHWLTRPRPVRLPLSTVRFVREAVRQRRARHRLRDLIVLLLRTAAVLLLAWALARPLFSQQPSADPEQEGDAARVVILDVSQSMAAGAHGIPVFERARPVAAKHLSDQGGLHANLILAGAVPRPVFERLSTNFAALRDEVGKARPRPERLNVQAALNQASELLARAGGETVRRRELVIVSDFQRANWAAANFAVLPEDTRVQLESVAPVEPLPNLAILRAGAQGRVEQGREVRLEVEVGNFSPTPRQVRVEVVLGDATYRLDGPCPPGSRVLLTTDVPACGLGWQAGEARLLNVEDALPADNIRPFVLDIRPPPTYALLTRQPADRRPSSSYFLERALVPLVPRPGRAEGKVVRLDPSQLDRDALAGAEVIALDHPGRLSGEVVQLLASLLRRGRGIFYVAAETADATNLKLGAASQALAKLQEQLAGERLQFEQQAMEGLEHLASIFPLIENQARFVSLYQQQKDLAERLQSLKGRDREDNPALKARMRDLQAAQQEIRTALGQLLDDIEDHVAKLPEDPKLDKLRQTALDFVKEARAGGAAEAMADAESGLAEFSGTKGHEGAQKAADLLEKLISKCQGMSSQGEGGVCLRFNPSLAEGLGNTIEQLLADAGLNPGNGQGGGSGYSARRNSMQNVGLYGQVPALGEMASRGGSSQRSASARGMGRSGRDERSEPASADAAAKRSAAGAAEAAVPPAYRRRVAEYFQRIADETGGK